MKYSIMLHFIWVFTVCQSTCLEISSIQKVDFVFIHTFVGLPVLTTV